jgi:very-short-patch-repair endonuclease
VLRFLYEAFTQPEFPRVHVSDAIVRIVPSLLSPIGFADIYEQTKFFLDGGQMLTTLIANWPWVVLGLILLCCLIASWGWRSDSKLPYDPRGSLLSQGEMAFYIKLRQAVEGRWSIFSKVRLADLLKVKSTLSKTGTWQNKINQKHIDFVICDHETLVPKLVIELDDATHQRVDRKLRDEFVDAAFSSAKLQLVRVKAQADYKIDDIKKLLGAIG